MKKTILSVTAAAALALAGVAAAPQPAQAFWWVIPAIIGGTVVGVGVGAAATNANYAYEPGPNVYVAPTGCHFVTERIGDHWRRVRVCD